MNKPLLEGATFVENKFPLNIRDNKGKLFPEFSAPLVSYFDTVRSCHPKQVSIYEALSLIHSSELKVTIGKLRKAANKTEREKLKQLLPSITVSGIFKNSHAEKNLIKHSGLIQIDFDNVPNPEHLKKILCNDVFTFSSFISPSGYGVKAIVKIPIEQHYESFKELRKYYLEKYHLPIDEKCKDLGRLMFLSYDNNLFLNNNSMVYNSTNKDVENIIVQIESKRIDITSTYNDWLRIGFAFADEFKEDGRELFHRISKYNSKYIKERTDKQFSECLKNRKEGTTIKTLFSIAKNYGLLINNYNKKGDIKPEIKATPNNETSRFYQVEKYLNEHFEFRYNEVSNDVKYKKKESENYEELNENDLYRHLQLQNISFSQSNLSALLGSGFVPKYNPFKEYFDNLPKWDEKTDVILKLCNYIEAKDQERFNRHFKKALIRCVACSLGRSFNKQAFILIGGQSSGKSTFIRWLCPHSLKNYFTESISTDKDSLISLCENFIINLDELAGLQKFEINALKSMLSKDAVKIRRPYDKKPIRSIRRANFFGSTNKDEFLTDETGSVRWLCFEIRKINYAYKNEIDIDLVWGQAYNLLNESFEYELTTTEINENENANAAYQHRTLEMELIQKYFEPAKKREGKTETMTATDISEKLKTIAVGTNNISVQNIGKALSFLGFEKVTERTGEEKVPRKVYLVRFIEQS